MHLINKNTKTSTGRLSVWCSFHFDSSRRSNSKRKKVETLFMAIWAAFYWSMPLIILKRIKLLNLICLKNEFGNILKKKLSLCFCWAWIQKKIPLRLLWWIDLIIGEEVYWRVGACLLSHFGPTSRPLNIHCLTLLLSNVNR